MIHLQLPAAAELLLLDLHLPPMIRGGDGRNAF
jgi:hypothetical protein